MDTIGVLTDLLLSASDKATFVTIISAANSGYAPVS